MVPEHDIIEVAQALISEGLNIPRVLEEHLVRRGHIKFLIEYHLSDNSLSIEKALDLFAKHLPQSAEEIVDLDIQLLVLLMDTAE